VEERKVVSAANEWRVWWVIELTGNGGVWGGAMEEDRRRVNGGHCPKNV